MKKSAQNVFEIREDESGNYCLFFTGNGEGNIEHAILPGMEIRTTSEAYKEIGFWAINFLGDTWDIPTVIRFRSYLSTVI